MSGALGKARRSALRPWTPTVSRWPWVCSSCNWRTFLARVAGAGCGQCGGVLVHLLPHVPGRWWILDDGLGRAHQEAITGWYRATGGPTGEEVAAMGSGDQ